MIIEIGRNRDKNSVGPPFFDVTFSLLMAPLLVIVPFGPPIDPQAAEPQRMRRAATNSLMKIKAA